MEPGLRDREYASRSSVTFRAYPLQWSPVLETGNTRAGERYAQQKGCGCNGARS